MSAASDSSLDLPPHKTPPRGREIVIRIYASENRPLTPPDTTQDEPRHNNGAHRLPEKPSHPPTPEKTPPRASIKQFRPEPKVETPPRLRSRGRKIRRNGACDSTIDLPKRGRYNTSAEDTEFLKPLAMSVADRQESTVPDRAQETHQQPVPSLSLEQFRKDISWPSADGPAVTDTDNTDSQRLSGVSTASTVEAMIVDDPARLTKRMLRHTEKRSSLRSASSPVTKSERTSFDSDPDSHHRLVHKAARITEQDRKSIVSEFSIPAGPTADAAPHQKFDVVPVVVIPERRSSLKSSSSVRNPSKASSSRRATTEPGSRASSSGPPHKRKQTMSDTVPVFLQNTDSNGVRRPVVPPRRSSLSAPTSANNSRAASLTSESLQSHTLAMEEMQKRRAEQPAPKPAPEPAPQPQRKSMSSDSHNVSEAPKTQSILIGVEDIAHLRTPSMPFSLGSMPSSPGTFELNEATAVNLFPHNNESLLLVDQQMRAEKENARAHQVDPRGESNNPHTPAIPLQDTPRQDVTAAAAAADVDSPLRNPRPAPQPPICQVIPPTPKKELEQQSSKGSDQGSGIRRFGSLRRAWSLRSRSESTTTTTTTASSPVKRSFSTSATNRKAGKEIDSRLHPFWRPRRFWDDDSSPPKSPEKESPTHNQTDMPKENDHIVKNSLGMPQPRIILNGPTTISTRHTNKEEPHKKLLYDPALNRSTMALNRTSKVFSFPLSLRQRRFNPLSWWGHGHRAQAQSPFATVRNLRKRIRRRLQLREEAKREAQRAKLKDSIGDVLFVESSRGTGVLPRGL